MEFEPISLNCVRPYLRFVLNTSNMLHAAYVVGLEHRIIFVLDGEGDFWIDGKAFKMQKNDVFYISAGVPYKISAVGTAQIVYLNFDLTMKNFHKKGQYRALPFSNIPKEEDVYLCPYRLNENGNEIKALYLSKATDIVSEALEISKYFNSGEGGSYKDNILSGKMLSLISKILMRDKNLTNKKSFISVAESVVQYIHKNYAKKISVEDIAVALNFHQSHLNRCLKKVFNSSVYNYLLEYRLQKAMELIVYTNESVSAIAELVGFSESRGFSVAFKKYYGASPTDFRK